ncbi:hypothetical protein DFP79_1652 [Marinomonas balearica]|uniref:Uncharacterized protein n=1 Tax=Marinomonas balearica TaxID=491947 RepID=A0A4R6MBG5_9GAMM|nr:hypothetical protein DFP79_1652 [Marinomonas balearica]
MGHVERENEYEGNLFQFGVYLIDCNLLFKFELKNDVTAYLVQTLQILFVL